MRARGQFGKFAQRPASSIIGAPLGRAIWWPMNGAGACCGVTWHPAAHLSRWRILCAARPAWRAGPRAPAARRPARSAANSAGRRQRWPPVANRCPHLAGPRRQLAARILRAGAARVIYLADPEATRAAPGGATWRALTRPPPRHQHRPPIVRRLISRRRPGHAGSGAKQGRRAASRTSHAGRVPIQRIWTNLLSQQVAADV